VADFAEALWVTAPGRYELRASTLAVPALDDVVVRARFSGVSRGTESLVLAGRVPASEHARMRAPFQEGDFPSPVKYGYASVGDVERGPEPLLGRTVFVLFPHQRRFVVPSGAVHTLPTGVPAERAVLAANMEAAVNGVWDARVSPGARVAVVGAGVVGCLTAWLAARVPGTDVRLIDVNPGRAATARALGVPFASPDDAPRDVDIVIHASGSPAGLELALTLAGFEGRIVEMSWFGDQAVPLTLGGAFHANRLTIASSQVGHVAPEHRARWSRARRLQLALALLEDPALDALITGESAFETLPDELPQILAAAGTLCHRIRY